MDICFYFQVHQPMRLKKFSIFETGNGMHYFDDELNSQIMFKVRDKCYLRTNALLLQLLEKHPEFKVSFSLTGVFMEQAEKFAPEVMRSFEALARTGRVDFLSETYYHSLSSLFADKAEFFEQVDLHKKHIAKLKPEPPTVFRNTEALFSNDIAYLAERMGYSGIMTEGLEHFLGWRSPNYTYKIWGCNGHIKALLRNYRLSDDVGYRFGAKWWSEYPLTADKYANWLSALQGDCVNLFMDYETFGEHQWEDTGIFKFLEALPGEVGKHRHLSFKTPSEVASHIEPKGEIDVPHHISWADMERDTSAWLGNDMQRACFKIIEELEPKVKQLGDAEMLHTWRLLQNSDHLYYLCTKSLSDQDVHNYFSPYESPFEAFINFMSILQDFRSEVNARLKK